MAVVSPEVLTALDSMRADWPDDDRWVCDLDPHEGEHWTIARHGGPTGRGEDVWLRWTPGDPARLVEHPACESTPNGQDDDETVCYLPDGHPEQHDDGDQRW